MSVDPIWLSVCMALHIGAVVLWLGHMFFWSIFAGVMLKNIKPAQSGAWLRDVSLSMGGLGWPALVVLICTGIAVIWMRGVTLSSVFSGQFFESEYGQTLALKIVLVGAMVVYQTIYGHRPAPRAVYANMLAAVAVVGLGVGLVRGF